MDNSLTFASFASVEPPAGGGDGDRGTVRMPGLAETAKADKAMAAAAATAGLHVMLAGGGTGGHVFPALAVGTAVLGRGGKVSFVGSPHGFEARLVPERGIPFHALPAKPVLGKGLLAKAQAALTLLASSWKARGLARQLAPNVVLGTGGYASAAPVLGARLAGTPVVLLEPNAEPGAANRFLSRFAAGCCVAFEEAGERLKCPTWVTGVPVREELFQIPDVLPRGPLRLLVLGGSQGSQQLNELLPAAAKLLPASLAPLTIVHQCGEKNLESTKAAWEAAMFECPAMPRVQVVPFIADTPAAMAMAHLVVSRAGAITLAELCAAGRASLLVPLSIAAGHQEGNAAALERGGAAEMLRSSEATPETLAERLGDLLGDRPRLEEMAIYARRLARMGAADAIADRLAEVARR
jgi:UDP-N-acetylglucosamine--N-acetylmuramyl-(pentapeptide) pyrophosphoryl-undecaprenol N-acetylglucosamine transferase